MSKTVSKFALAAGLVLAMAFTVSCSSGDEGGNGDGDSSSGGTQGGGVSSSSGGGDLGGESSSSVGSDPSSSSSDEPSSSSNEVSSSSEEAPVWLASNQKTYTVKDGAVISSYKLLSISSSSAKLFPWVSYSGYSFRCPI